MEEHMRRSGSYHGTEKDQCFVRYMETWEQPERKVQAISEKKVWTLSQSSDAKGMSVVHVREKFMSLADSKPKKDE